MIQDVAEWLDALPSLPEALSSATSASHGRSIKIKADELVSPSLILKIVARTLFGELLDEKVGQFVNKNLRFLDSWAWLAFHWITSPRCYAYKHNGEIISQQCGAMEARITSTYPGKSRHGRIFGNLGESHTSLSSGVKRSTFFKLVLIHSGWLLTPCPPTRKALIPLCPSSIFGFKRVRCLFQSFPSR